MSESTSQIPGYQLISKRGKGAMANVYKARQISLDRIVAVKVLPKRMSENKEFVERFYKEGTRRRPPFAQQHRAGDRRRLDAGRLSLLRDGVHRGPDAL